jgi:nicotinamidase-related amidase
VTILRHRQFDRRGDPIEESHSIGRPHRAMGERMNDCLILIDLQNDYFPGGNMELVGIEEAAEHAQLLLKKFRTSNWPMIHIQHISNRPGATFFLPRTDGSKINEMVEPQEGEIVVVKNYPNSFRQTDLLEILRKAEIKNLVICGAMSHMCIDSTTRAAFDLGFNCVVAEDACATRDLIFKDRTVNAFEVHASFMAALSASYAKIVMTNEIIQD